MGLIIKSPIVLESGLTLTNAYLTFLNQKVENRQSFIVEYVAFASKEAYYNGFKPVFKSKVELPYSTDLNHNNFDELIYSAIKTGYEETEDVLKDDISDFTIEKHEIIEELISVNNVLVSKAGNGYAKSYDLNVTIKSKYDLEIKSVQSASGVDFKDSCKFEKNVLIFTEINKKGTEMDVLYITMKAKNRKALTLKLDLKSN
jgi:hypothetical protein